MANWNLSVELRGQGNDLARKLRDAATGARSLGTAARSAQNDVRQLGTASTSAGKAAGKLGTASQTAAARLRAMSTQAKSAARDLRTLERALARTDQQIRAMSNRVRINATLDDDTGAGIAAVRTAIADLRSMSSVSITARFDGDAAQIAAAATAMGELRNHADHADTALTALTTRATTTAAALNRVQQEAQDASRALRTLRGRAAAAAAALDELGDRARHAANGIRSLGTGANRANRHLTTLSGNTRTLRGDLDTLDGSLTQVTGHMNGLRGSLGRVSTSTSTTSGNLNGASGNMQNLILAAVGLGSALIPIAAATAPIAAGLGAAGIAVGAFGAAVAGQIMALTESAEAEEKYQQAVREHGASSAEAAKAENEYLRLMAEMPPASREAAAALTVLKDEYKDWSNALAADTMPVVVKGMGLMQAALPKLTPLVSGASAEFSNLMDVLAGGMSTPGFDRFVASFTQFATGALSRGTLHLVEFTQALDTGEIGSNLREFLDYARTNGPLVGDTLTNLSQAVLHLLVAMSEMGVSVLTVINALAGLINAIPSSALANFVQLYAVLKLVSLGMAAVTAMAGAGAVASITAFGRALMFGGVGPAITGLIQRMSALQKATVGLAILAVVAVGIDKLADKARGAPPDIDRLTTSLQRLAQTGKFSGELEKTFGDLDGLVEKVKELNKQNEAMNETPFGFRIPILDDISESLAGDINDMEKGSESLKALKEDFDSLDKSLAGVASGGHGKDAAKDFTLIADALRGAGLSTAEINKLFPEYKATVASLAEEQKLAADGMGLFGSQAIATKEKLDAQKVSADGLAQSVNALNNQYLQARGGVRGMEAAIDAASEALKKNGATLDEGTEKGRANNQALDDIASSTMKAAEAARANGASWETVNGIYDQGRTALVASAQAMGSTKTEAQALAASILSIPADHTTNIQMIREDAIAGLDQVIQKIEATPNAKSITVNALTSTAKELLNSLGYQTKTLPDGRVEVTAYTGGALSGLRAVKSARDSLSDKTITITTHYRITGSGAAQQATRSGSYGRELAGSANGNIFDSYANGGIRGAVQRFAQGGSTSPDTKNGHLAHIAKAGTWRVFAEDETGGESYIPLHPSKRSRSRAIAEETIRRLGGDPRAVQWNAAGSVTDWRYDPNSGSLYSASDAGSAGNKTKKVKVKGGKTKEVKYFDLAAVEKQLKANSKATTAWNKDLEKVADRAGGDVAQALAAMGKDGIALTHKMATGSTKYINEMAKALRGLAAEAKASLTDYTRELSKATVADSTFAKNLALLAGKGYGDLAKQLAAQGDQAAMELAASAVGDNKKASAANTAAQKANNALTNEQVQQLVEIIAAIKTNKTGIHDVAATTGLGEDDIIATANKALTQIKGSLGSRATKFITDLARANKGMSYANGGIREGIYSTTAGAVTFAEPSTGGEAFIPLGANKRRQATNVLKDVAGRFGVGLTDMAATRPVYIVREGGDTHVSVTAVRTGASASDIGSQVGRSVRRARRGGVNARAAA